MIINLVDGIFPQGIAKRCIVVDFSGFFSGFYIYQSAYVL